MVCTSLGLYAVTVLILQNWAREKYIMYPKYPNLHSVPIILVASFVKNKVYFNQNNIVSTIHDMCNYTCTTQVQEQRH